MKKLFFLLTIVPFLIISCEKENVNSNQSDNENFKSTVNSTLTMDEKVQYFNSLGEEHNEVLDYIGDNIDVSVATQEQRFDLVSEYFNDYSYTYENFLEDYPVVDEILNNPSNTANLLFTDEDVTCNLSSYYNSLGEIFVYCMEMADDSIEVTPSEFNEMVNELEESVYENYTVEIDPETNTGDEASLFLGACAIARHSYMYWNDAVNNETHPWYSFFYDEQSKKSDFWKKLWHGTKVVCADVGGFLLGGFGLKGDIGDPGDPSDDTVAITFSGRGAVQTASEWSGSVEGP